jgi:hypothetical protein
MQNNYYSLDDQMDEIGMDVDTEDINIDEAGFHGSGLSQQFTNLPRKQIVSAQRQPSYDEP